MFTIQQVFVLIGLTALVCTLFAGWLCFAWGLGSADKGHAQNVDYLTNHYESELQQLRDDYILDCDVRLYDPETLQRIENKSFNDVFNAAEFASRIRTQYDVVLKLQLKSGSYIELPVESGII